MINGLFLSINHLKNEVINMHITSMMWQVILIQ